MTIDRRLLAGALGLVRLAERMRQELPSGWPGQIPADPAVWEELEREHDADGLVDEVERFLREQ